MHATRKRTKVRIANAQTHAHVHAQTHTCLHTCIRTNACVHACVCMCACMSVRACTRACVCAFVMRACVRAHAFVRACICACMCACMHACMHASHTRTYVSTHAHVAACQVPFSIVSDHPVAQSLCSDRNAPCGVDPELWQLLAAELRLKVSEWEWVYKPLDQLASATADGSCDVSMCAIRATQALIMNRLLHVSQPYAQMGLQLLLPPDRKVGGWEMDVLFSPYHGFLLVVSLAGCIVIAHLVWLFERDYNPKQFPKPYVAGNNDLEEGSNN